MKQLTSVLKVNGISSGATGIGLIVFSKSIATLFAVTSTVPFTEAGIFLVVFALFVLIVSSRDPLPVAAVKFITMLDVLWVAASVVTLILLHDSISTIGNIVIAGVALWVALMAFLQNRGLKVSRSNFARTAALVIPTLFLLTTNVTAQKSGDPVTVVTSFLEAVKEKSHAKAAPLLDSLIEWDQPGNNRFSGVKKNAKEVFAMFKGFIETSATTLKLEEVQVVAVNDNTVACSLKWTAIQPTGKVLKVDNIDVYTIMNGKIKKAVVYSADLEQEDSFWGK